MIRNGPLLIEGMAQTFDPAATLIKESDRLLPVPVVNLEISPLRRQP